MGVINETRKIKAFAKNEAIDYIFMQKVLKSIAPKHTDILRILGELQLSKSSSTSNSIGGDTTSTNSNPKTNGNEKYVTYTEWKTQCFNKMLTSKETEFKSMMKELIDHKIIELRKDSSVGRDYVYIPASRAKVQEILTKISSKS